MHPALGENPAAKSILLSQTVPLLQIIGPGERALFVSI